MFRIVRLIIMSMFCCLVVLDSASALGPPCDWGKMARAGIEALLAIAWKPK
jgi:hypothetical protein